LKLGLIIYNTYIHVILINKNMSQLDTDTNTNTNITTLYAYYILRFGSFIEICKFINIKLDIEYFKQSYESTEIIKYKLDCLNDYTIFMRQSCNLICCGQQNILNINDLLPCQVINMKINYQSFSSLLAFNYNLECYEELTEVYIDRFKIYVTTIIDYILNKLNYSQQFELIEETIDKINDIFYYENIINISPTSLQINSDEEKKYWTKIIKYYLDKINDYDNVSIHQLCDIKYLYNILHKYLHYTFKYKIFFQMIINKNSVIINNDIPNMIYKRIKKLSITDHENNQQMYIEMIQIMYTMNAIKRVSMFVGNDKNAELIPIYKIK